MKNNTLNDIPTGHNQMSQDKTSKKDIYFLILLIALLFIVNYSFLDNSIKNFLTTSETALVERVIDGDTVVINGTSIRLLGINSPERGEEYYEEAKEFLDDLILNKTISLEYGKDKTDRYGRILAYVYFRNKNVNLKLVENGLANFYFPAGKDQHYSEFKNAWENCVSENKNLCEKSADVCATCIELKNLDSKNQEVIFYNKCSFDCDLNHWGIKDEGRKNFIFESFILEKNSEVVIKVGEGSNSPNILYWDRSSYVWTSTGDTLFLRDKFGKLILWESY